MISLENSIKEDQSNTTAGSVLPSMRLTFGTTYGSRARNDPSAQSQKVNYEHLQVCVCVRGKGCKNSTIEHRE